MPSKVGIRMLIEEPHSLCGIDGGATAQRDDDIRLEVAHDCYAAHDGLYRRIRFYLSRKSHNGSMLARSSQIDTEAYPHIPVSPSIGSDYDESSADVRHNFSRYCTESFSK